MRCYSDIGPEALGALWKPREGRIIDLVRPENFRAMLGRAWATRKP